MKRLLLITYLVFLLAGNALAIEDSPEGVGKWEFWHSEKFEKPLNRRLKCYLETEFKYHRGEHYYKHTDLSLWQKISPGMEVAGGFRKVWDREPSGWKAEDRPYVRIVPAWRMGTFKLLSRNTFEFRNFRFDKPDVIRYRNKIVLSHPVKVGATNIEPYVGDEFFMDLNGKNSLDLSKNRISVGIKGRISKNLQMELFYIRQSLEKELDEGEIWRNYNVLGLKVKVTF